MQLGWCLNGTCLSGLCHTCLLHSQHSPAVVAAEPESAPPVPPHRTPNLPPASVPELMSLIHHPTTTFQEYKGEYEKKEYYDKSKEYKGDYEKKVSACCPMFRV